MLFFKCHSFHFSWCSLDADSANQDQGKTQTIDEMGKLKLEILYKIFVLISVSSIVFVYFGMMSSRIDNLFVTIEKLSIHTLLISSKTKHLSEKAVELSMKTNKLTETAEALSILTKKLSLKSNRLSNKTKNLSGKTNDLSGKMNNLSEKTGNLTEKTIELSMKTSNLSNTTSELSEKTKILSKETNDLAVRSKSLSDITRDLSSKLIENINSSSEEENNIIEDDGVTESISTETMVEYEELDSDPLLTFDEDSFDQYLFTHPLYSKFNLTISPQKKRLNLVVIVSSAPKRTDRRQAIRDTWWQQCKRNDRVS